MSQMSIILRLDVLGSESKLPMNRVVKTSKTVKFTVTLAWKNLGWNSEIVRNCQNVTVSKYTGLVRRMSHRKLSFSPFGATHTIKWPRTGSNSISSVTFCLLTWYLLCRSWLRKIQCKRRHLGGLQSASRWVLFSWKWFPPQCPPLPSHLGCPSWSSSQCNTESDLWALDIPMSPFVSLQSSH